MNRIDFTHNTQAAEVIAAHYDSPPLAFVHSYGCQQNVNDGEKIKGVLVDAGYGLCDKFEDADLILFNTCAVREHAEERVFGNVGALKQLKAKNPRLIIGICGCMTQQEGVVERLRKSYPFVDLVFGVNGIDTLPQLLAEKMGAMLIAQRHGSGHVLTFRLLVFILRPDFVLCRIWSGRRSRIRLGGSA